MGKGCGSEVNIPEEQVVRLGLEIFAEQNLDFVDCILYAYNRGKGYEVKTFDKRSGVFICFCCNGEVSEWN